VGRQLGGVVVAGNAAGAAWTHSTLAWGLADRTSHHLLLASLTLHLR